MSPPDFHDLLNAEQCAAAMAPDGPILVLAAAGTGKTRTLVFRVAHLVRRGVPADRILLLTFTNKAAREMLERARAVVGGEVSGIWGGTFHHLAHRMLRRYAGRLGYGSDFVILDRDDSRGLVAQCLKDLKLERTEEAPRPAVLLGLFSAAANTETPLADLAAQRAEDFSPETVVAVGEAYVKRKRELGAMDFDDLLVNGLTLLREHVDVLQGYQRRFAHILVDEYQDTNPLQAETVDKLGAVARNVFVVGDDFQCIYTWRGADFRNIMTFPQRYPGAQVYKLETNYRSAPEILAVANACIAGNPEQFQKTLRATRPAHRRPVVARLPDGEQQALYVIEQIRALRREGYALRDIAVLYRAHFHALDLERMLPRARLRYVITSGVRFFEQVHIKDVLSVLRLRTAPTDELAFARLLCLLPKVGARTALKLWVRMGARCDLRDPAQVARLGEGLGAAARAVWNALAPVWASDPPDGAAMIETFLNVFYEDYLHRTFENADERLDDLSALMTDVARHESIVEFLSDVALLTNVDGDDADEENGGDALRLSTVHQAKGLEWGAVIILWAVEGMFPSSRSLNESPAGEAEERRLFYVAITRAKDHLLICAPEVRFAREGGTIFCTPSRFVEEIPRPLLDSDHVGFL